MKSTNNKIILFAVLFLFIGTLSSTASAAQSQVCEGSQITWKATSPNGTYMMDFLVNVVTLDSYVLEGTYYENQGEPIREQVLTDINLNSAHLLRFGVDTNPLKYITTPSDLSALKTQLQSLENYTFEQSGSTYIITQTGTNENGDYSYRGEVTYDPLYVLVSVEEQYNVTAEGVYDVYDWDRIAFVAGNACQGLFQEERESGDSGSSSVSAGSSTPGSSLITLGVAALLGFLVMKRKQSLME